METSQDETKTKTEAPTKVERVQHEDDAQTRLQQREVEMQRYLNALPEAQRRERVLALRQMRRYAGLFCHHPKMSRDSRGKN